MVSSTKVEGLEANNVALQHYGQKYYFICSLVEYYTITAKDQSRIHQFGKNVLPGLFLGYALYAGGI